MTVGEALRAATAWLSAVGVPGAARDARVLMADALNQPPGRLALVERDALPEAAARRFAAMVSSRARRQPVAQILGRRAFWGREFAVTRDVLDPRPETEALVACALAGPEPRGVLDLGTGSGAILLSLLAEWPEAEGLGTDICGSALAVAARNAAELGIGQRARFLQADWTAGVAGRFDLVVCNPPYIPRPELEALAPDVREWEPVAALSPGETGLEAYRRIAPALPAVMAPGARALFEIGQDRAPAVAAIFRDSGLAVAAVHPDLDGRDRVVAVEEN